MRLGRARRAPASAPGSAPGRWRAASGAGARAPRRACRSATRARSLEQDELDRDDVGALVQHLEVGVLAVRARLAPDDRAGRERQRRAAAVDALAVAFHLELLQVGGQPLQRLRVRRDAAAREAVEVAVPDVDAGRAASAGSARPAPARSARPSRARRRAARESARRRSRSRSAGRSPTRASSGRRPSPRSRRCVVMPKRAAASTLVVAATKCSRCRRAAVGRGTRRARPPRWPSSPAS